MHPRGRVAACFESPLCNRFVHPCCGCSSPCVDVDPSSTTSIAFRTSWSERATRASALGPATTQARLNVPTLRTRRTQRCSHKIERGTGSRYNQMFHSSPKCLMRTYFGCPFFSLVCYWCQPASPSAGSSRICTPFVSQSPLTLHDARRSWSMKRRKWSMGFMEFACRRSPNAAPTCTRTSGCVKHLSSQLAVRCTSFSNN